MREIPFDEFGPETMCLEIYGKPGQKKCGIPHEFGSTGFGVAQATKVAADKYLTQMGAKVVGLAEIRTGKYKYIAFPGPKGGIWFGVNEYGIALTASDAHFIKKYPAQRNAGKK